MQEQGVALAVALAGRRVVLAHPDKAVRMQALAVLVSSAAGRGTPAPAGSRAVTAASRTSPTGPLDSRTPR